MVGLHSLFNTRHGANTTTGLFGIAPCSSFSSAVKCDMDFVPSATLYRTLVDVYLPVLAHIDRPALVVPHWELLRCSGDNNPAVPLSFRMLDRMARAGRARPFHCDPKHLMPTAAEFAAAHTAVCAEGKAVWWRGIETTNYFRWVRESRVGIQGFYRIATEGPMQDAYYEPFVVVKRRDARSRTALPRYPEHYVGE